MCVTRTAVIGEPVVALFLGVKQTVAAGRQRVLVPRDPAKQWHGEDVGVTVAVHVRRENGMR